MLETCNRQTLPTALGLGQLAGLGVMHPDPHGRGIQHQCAMAWRGTRLLLKCGDRD